MYIPNKEIDITMTGYPATWETHLQEACRIQEDISKSPLPVITGDTGDTLS